MPGYVIHLATAEQTIKELRKKGIIIDKSFEDEFKIGSIAPDTKKGSNKYLSHFWDEHEYRLFARTPVLKDFEAKYTDRVVEPYILGYYAHLYLDKLFMDKYWTKHFSFYDKDMRDNNVFDEVAYVRLNDNNKIYPRSEFLSDTYYYGDYDRMNAAVIDTYGIKIPDIAAIDNIVGIEEINHKESKEIIKKMLDKVGEKGDINGIKNLKILVYPEILHLIEITTEHLVNKLVQ